MNQLFLGLLSILVTTNLSSQCYPDRHSTSVRDGWISCNIKSSPNPARSYTHWIEYDFGTTQNIDGIKIWNSNLPDFEDVAIRELAIDISPDGENWVDLGVFELSEHQPDVLYQGEEVGLSESFSAQKVLFTAISTYGAQCAGLAEVKFSLGNTSTSTDDVKEWTYSVFPNPTSDFINIIIEEPEFNIDSYEIINLKGQILTRIKESGSNFSIDMSGYPSGAYVLKINGDNRNLITDKIHIVHP